MSEVNSEFAASAWFADYHVAAPSYDELGRGTIPEHWRQVLQYFALTADPGNPENRRQDMLVRNLDVERPWRLDPIPFTLGGSEWQQLEQLPIGNEDAIRLMPANAGL